MSGVSMELNYSDRTARIVRALQIVQSKGRATRPLMLSVGEYLVRSTSDRFREQRSPEGIPWEPLAPATLIRKKVKMILTERSRLQGSVVYRATATSVTWGSNVIYARIHQKGGTIDRKERDQVIHFKRGTVDQFANPDDADRHVRMPNGRTLHFRTGAGAGFARANKKASYAMKVKVSAHSINIPKRPYLGVSSRDAQELLARVKDYYLDAIS